MVRPPALPPRVWCTALLTLAVTTWAMHGLQRPESQEASAAAVPSEKEPAVLPEIREPDSMAEIPVLPVLPVLPVEPDQVEAAPDPAGTTPAPVTEPPETSPPSTAPAVQVMEFGDPSQLLAWDQLDRDLTVAWVEADEFSRRCGALIARLRELPELSSGSVYFSFDQHRPLVFLSDAAALPIAWRDFAGRMRDLRRSLGQTLGRDVSPDDPMAPLAVILVDNPSTAFESQGFRDQEYIVARRQLEGESHAALLIESGHRYLDQLQCQDGQSRLPFWLARGLVVACAAPSLDQAALVPAGPGLDELLAVHEQVDLEDRAFQDVVRAEAWRRGFERTAGSFVAWCLLEGGDGDRHLRQALGEVMALSGQQPRDEHRALLLQRFGVTTLDELEAQWRAGTQG